MGLFYNPFFDMDPSQINNSLLKLGQLDLISQI
jgi:hypothetical protein